MSIQEDSLRPEELAEAAAAAIADALGRDFREAASVLADAGLLGVCAAEGASGLGLGLEFALPITEAAGRLQLRFPLVEQIVLARALGDTEFAEALASGAKVGTIAWQGSIDRQAAAHAGHAADCDWVLVADADGACLLDMASVRLEADTALDPEHPQYELALEGATVVARLSADAYAVLRADAQVLLGGFVSGAGAGALQRAAEYMSTRVQFGRPLSAKQSVRHTLARMRLLHEASSAALRRALCTDEFGTRRSATTAFAGAVASAVFIIEKAIHLHGGMGFTWEMPLHYSLRDVRKVDAAFDCGRLAQDIGKTFIATA